MQYTELFNDKSEIYASARPGYPIELYRYLGEQCSALETAWDCGCGNGQAAIELAALFNQVLATDISENQITNAFKKPNIQYSVCPSEKTPFANNSVDLVCVAQALHWMQYEQFWPEVDRLLKPGGVFATWGYCWVTISPEIDDLIEHHILAVIEPYWADQNRLLWDHYRDLSIPYNQLDSPKFEMTMHWNLNQLFAYLHSWSAVRRCMEQTNEDFFNKAYAAVKSAWGNADQIRKVETDFFCIASKRQENRGSLNPVY